MRIDKWLWAARFYKTRSLAAQAVDSGKISLNGERCKPAKEIRVDDELNIRIGEVEWQIKVRELSEKRGPAIVAQTLYVESVESRAQRDEQSALRKLTKEPAREIKGRPTKRDRRALSRCQGSE